MAVELLGTTKRRIPTLAEHLDGTRGEMFEEWVALSLEMEGNASTPTEKRALRLMRMLLIAMVEGMNREAPGLTAQEVTETFLMIPRAAGYAAVNAMASVVHDDTPHRRLIPILVEEFRHGAKLAADALEAECS